MADFNSTHTGTQLDAAIEAAMSPDNIVREGSTKLVTSGAVHNAMGKQKEDADAQLQRVKETPVIWFGADEIVGGEAPAYSIGGATKGLSVIGNDGIKTFSALNYDSSRHALVVSAKPLKDKVEANEKKLSELDYQVNGGGSEDVVMIVPETAKEIAGNEASTINIIPNTSVDVKAGNRITIDVDGCPWITRRWNFYINGAPQPYYSPTEDIELTEDLTSVRVSITSPSSALTGVSGTVTAKIYIKGKEGGEGLMQKVQKNIEDIAKFKDIISVLNDKAESLNADVEGVKNAVGNIKGKSESKEIKNELAYEVGGINGGKVSIGGQVSVGYNTSTSYARTIISANKGRTYKIVTRTNGATTTNYPNFIFLADLDGKCIAKYGEYTGVEANVEATLIPTEDSLIFVCIKPLGTIANNISVIEEYVEPYSIEEQIDDIDKRVQDLEEREDDSALVWDEDEMQGYPSQKTANGLMNYVLRDFETSLKNNMLERLKDKNPSHRFINFLFITDTHQFGNYLKRNDTSERSIKVFTDLMQNSLFDFSVHGGDISTDYGLSAKKVASFTKRARDMFGRYTKNFIVTKGNHDYNSDPYIEATEIDWDNNTYYIHDETVATKTDRLHIYTEITQEDWDGVSTLYIKQDNFVTDSQFGLLTQFASPENAVYDNDNPNGAYFYSDFEDYKIRVICLNNHPVDDSLIFNAPEYVGKQIKWLAQKALDLQGKPNWAVMTIGHISIDSFNAKYRQPTIDIINAFINGTSVIGNIGGNDYSMNFSTQGRGLYVGNLHGHEHKYIASTQNGFNDIGFSFPVSDYSYIGRNDGYLFDIVIVDTDTRKIHTISTNNINDREFDY